MNTLALENILLQRQAKTLLDISQLSAQSGEFIAVLGPNGAGKSSLLKVISGEWPADRGRILIHNRARHDWPRQQLARQLGVLPQSSSLNFPFTVNEVVAMGAIPLNLRRKAIAEQMQQFLEITDCADFADRLYISLSGGERQRVQLARVLLQLSQAEQPAVLLLDEPVSAQDLGQQHQLLALMRSLCHEKGYTVLAVLHDLNHAARYADRIWLMHQGRLHRNGRPDQTLQPDEIAEIWGYRPTLVHGPEQQTILY